MERRYGEDAVKRLTFIRHARDFGFSVNAVRELLTLSDQPHMPCQDVDTIARHHLEKVELRLQRLLALREELKRMVNQCAGGNVENCHIIEVLSDHQRCINEQAHQGARELG